MTANRIGLAILAAIAVALGVAHAVAGGRAAPPSRAIFDERVTAATALGWTRGADRIAIDRRGDAWRMTAPSEGPVDAAVVADVLGALRGARWQRTASAAPGPARLALAIDAETIELGPDVPGVGSWLHRGGRWYLVESWVIAALDRDALSLRPRLPFAAPLASFRRLTVKSAPVDIELVAPPLALVTPDGPMRIRPEVADTIVGRLAEVHVERLVEGDIQPRPTEVTITVEGARGRVTLEVRGQCPHGDDLLWVGGTGIGEACVSAAAVVAFEALVEAVDAGRATYADPRLAPGPHKELTLLSGATLAWHGAAVMVDGRPADDEAVARVVAALDALATPRLVSAPRPPASAAITVDGRRLELVDGTTLVPTDTRYGHRVEPDVLAALRLGVDELRDRVVLRTEPSLLTGLAIVEGGATRDEPVDSFYAHELAEAVREVRADGFLAAAPPSPRRTIDLTYAPPPTTGARPERHRIELGADTRNGCAAIVDDDAVVLPRRLCVVLGKPTPP